MRLGVGTADVPYSPPLEVDGGGLAAPEALKALDGIELLADVPVAVSLLPGEVVGVVGPLPVARAVARGLILQAAVLHGPADLAIAGLVPGLATEWSWMGWLPHTIDIGGEPGALVATEPGTTAAAAEAAAASSRPPDIAGRHRRRRDAHGPLGAGPDSARPSAVRRDRDHERCLRPALELHHHRGHRPLAPAG